MVEEMKNQPALFINNFLMMKFSRKERKGESYSKNEK